MGLSIFKIAGTGTGTGTSLRSISRSLYSYRGSGILRFYPFHEEDEVSHDSLSSSSPLLMLSPSSYNTRYDLYSFAKNRVFTIPKSEKSTFRYATKIVGSSQGWLACFNHRRNELYLSNPISGRRVNLPPIDIPKSYLIHGNGIKKIIISCSDPESEECRVIMYNHMRKLVYCCPGISSSSIEWTTIKEDNDKDFVYCSTHELLFTRHRRVDVHFGDKSKLEAWDLRNPLSPTLIWSCGLDKLEYCIDNGEQCYPAQQLVFTFNYQEYLVVSQQGVLFLVRRYIDKHVLHDGSCVFVDPEEYPLKVNYPPKTFNFKVYKIVREGDRGKMVYMDGHLDDQVMFVGWLSHGMVMPAADADGFQPNTICFTDDAFTQCTKSVRGTDNGIYDYKNNTFHPCYYPCDYKNLQKKIMPPPLWLAPN
ncbi:hypothetical protein CASFOL_008726 [Castilleja foliolosa]|uniref:KIB1-4 beta-propeller domain-containing protein n=1 Tax=Castilleja foliolosa TaxID=1961234 RepID=A0ABD3DZS7_9LAMI